MIEKDTLNIANTILLIIYNEFDSYIQKNSLFRYNADNTTPYNEEKLNSYLILFSRCIGNHANIISLINKLRIDTVEVLLKIFLLCSDKNKTVALKLVNQIILNTKSTTILNEIFESTAKIYKAFIKLYFSNLYDYCKLDDFSNENAFYQYINYMFKLILALQNDNSNLLWRSPNDKEFSWDILEHIRTLLSIESIRKDIVIYMNKILEKNNNDNEKITIFMLLGANFNKLKVGSLVGIKLNINLVNNENNLFEFLNKEVKEVIKTAVILGFSNNPKNPFVIDEVISEFSYEEVSTNYYY